MDRLEQSGEERGAARRFTARFAVLWAEHRHVAERLAAIESSTAWAVARRLSQLRRRLAPEGSRRYWCFRLCLRGLRLWRREGITGFLRRSVDKLLRHRNDVDVGWAESSRPTTPSMPTPRTCEFRVAFIGSESVAEAATMRYRAHHIIEALALDGLEGTFVALDKVDPNLPAILSHDLIVLVRTRYNDTTAAIIDSVRRRGLPIVYDIDDYLFDPWVMPYIEALQSSIRQVDALHLLQSYGACLEHCDYFTGSTSYLAEKAAEFGKPSFVIHNGFSTAQQQLSRSALEHRNRNQRGHGTRIGYFSGTRTHQADFRVVYPALMSVLREQAATRLLIVGHLNIDDFPGLALYMDQIDFLPICHWSELPAVITSVDINLIPLDLTPFNEGKSNLKYYEAALLKVPSIASPTRIHRENITPGYNGLLAHTTREWYTGLTELITRPDRLEEMGQNAFEHVLRKYTPTAIGAEAVTTYRQILHHHRSQQVAA